MPARRVGPYRMFDAFASGGMASIHFGRRVGASGFARMVALKRLHPQLAKDAEFVSMFTDEARVSARVQHPNVVGVHDVVKDDDELVLVMDYVHGEPLSKLLGAVAARDERVPPRIAAGIVAQALHGLHAAHEARGDHGKPLGIVHRDVSPQNVLVGADGVARVVDFGVAKSLGKAQHTAEGNMKGKIRYFAPEQLSNDVDRRTDVFAAGVVLWEALRGERLFSGDTQWDIIQSVLSREIPAPLEDEPGLSAVVSKALRRDREARYPTARAMASALEGEGVASTAEISEWIERVAGDDLEARRALVVAIEGLEDVEPPPSIRAPRAATLPAHAAQTPAPRDEDPAPRPASARPRPARIPWVAITGVGLGASGLAFGVGVMMKDGRVEPATTALASARDAPDVVVTSEARPRVAPTSLVSDVATAAPSVSAPPSAASSGRASASPSAVRRPAASRHTKVGSKCDDSSACGPNELCDGGVCACPGEICGGACFDTYRDANNCGSCGKVCGPTEFCRGVCLACVRPHHEQCGSTCVEIQNDVRNCGQCGHRCEPGQYCAFGNCSN